MCRELILFVRGTTAIFSSTLLASRSTSDADFACWRCCPDFPIPKTLVEKSARGPSDEIPQCGICHTLMAPLHGLAFNYLVHSRDQE